MKRLFMPFMKIIKWSSMKTRMRKDLHKVETCQRYVHQRTLQKVPLFSEKQEFSTQDKITYFTTAGKLVIQA